MEAVDGSFTANQFHELWATGEPIVVSGVHKRLQGHWTPDDFIKRYGSQTVVPIDCATDKPVKRAWKVAEFFELMKNPDAREGVYKLKVSIPPLQLRFVCY